MKALLLSALFPSLLWASSDISGKWKTIDDVTKLPKSVVEISLDTQGNYSGKIVKLFRGPTEDQNPKCEFCEAPLKNSPILGLQIISSIKKEGEEYAGGTILDPKNGKSYKCKIKKEGENLIVRGFIGFSLLGRSQTWLPYQE